MSRAQETGTVVPGANAGGRGPAMDTAQRQGAG